MHVFQYVDFVFVGPPCSQRCSRDLQLFVDTCSELGIELAVDKTEGSSTCLTIHNSWNRDKLAGNGAQLQQAKLARLVEAIRSWRGNSQESERI